MSSSSFAESKLSKLVLQEVNCKKLEAPSKDAHLNIKIAVGLSFDDKKTEYGYNTLYDMLIKCEENGEEKLFSLNCKIRAAYQMNGSKTEISKGFQNNQNLFLREMYNMTREDINAILDKMNVYFQLPLSLPDKLKIEFEKVKK